LIYRSVRCVSLLLLLVLALPLLAQQTSADNQRFVVDIELQTVEEFRQLLERAEQLLLEGAVSQEDSAKLTFVLHGPVLRNLLRQNYLDNKKTVDMAASLSALGVIDVKACRAWMGINSVNEKDLQPFIETVSYGPAEVQMLVKEKNYIYF
jgi:intracellular sulfur oxidation DsrE/DsrF family protein